MTEPRAIALFLPNWIGDVVMATPAIRAIREGFPGANLFAVCKPYVADTLAGAPWFQGVLSWNRRGTNEETTYSVWKRLRAEQVDAAVLFPNSLRPALLAKLAGCRRIVGFARYFRHLVLTDRLYPVRGPRGELKPHPALLDYNRLAMELGATDPGVRMELFTTANDEAAAEAVLGELPVGTSIVTLNAGGAFGSSKHWSTESFAQVARSLIDDRDACVIVLCGPSEREQAAAIARATHRPGKIVSVGACSVPLSIGLTKALVRCSDLLVTTDSGPRHFAAAFDVPVVTLFGPTHIDWTETWFPKALHLQVEVPCGPCQQRVCPLGHHRCMTELTPAMVIAASVDLLRRFKDEPPEASRHVRRLIPLAG